MKNHLESYSGLLESNRDSIFLIKRFLSGSSQLKTSLLRVHWCNYDFFASHFMSYICWSSWTPWL